MEHLPCNESFETTHDLGFAAPFSQPPRRIGLGLLVPKQAYDNDAVERCIGLAVASAIEAMTIGLTRTGGQGADATERSKRCI
jgi:hypothetical protein